MPLPNQVNIGTKSHPRFEQLTFGDGVALSIQGSRTHYSTPRENLEYLDDFEEVEIAVFKDSRWAVPVEFLKLFEPGGCPVAPYVPKATAEEMVERAKAGTLEVSIVAEIVGD